MSTSLSEQLESLKGAAYSLDEDAVQENLFNLGAISLSRKQSPEEVVDFLLALLKDDYFNSENIAGHLLNYFEFESAHLSAFQKNKITEWIANYGAKFTSTHGNQVVCELNNDEYLK